MKALAIGPLGLRQAPGQSGQSEERAGLSGSHALTSGKVRTMHAHIYIYIHTHFHLLEIVLFIIVIIVTIIIIVIIFPPCWF